ncbi:MAG: hypothetical protein PHV93_02435 [Candidatus Pacebacteria bacterium]|nr:hypothetical protein [Candidatus Paceibacterota bacterium]
MNFSFKKFLAVTLCIAAIFVSIGSFAGKAQAGVGDFAGFTYKGFSMIDKGVHTFPNGSTYHVYSSCYHTDRDPYGVCGGGNIIQDVSTGKYYDIPSYSTTPGTEQPRPSGAPGFTPSNNPPPPTNTSGDGTTCDPASGNCVAPPPPTPTPPPAPPTDAEIAAAQGVTDANGTLDTATQALNGANVDLATFQQNHPELIDANGNFIGEHYTNTDSGYGIIGANGETLSLTSDQYAALKNQYQSLQATVENDKQAVAEAEQNLNTAEFDVDNTGQSASELGASSGFSTADLAGAVGPASEVLTQPEEKTVEAGAQAGAATRVPIEIDPAVVKAIAKTDANTGAQVKKAFSLDGIAKMIAERMVHQIATSIVQWVNTGFKGAPAFVTDMKGFLEKVGDDVTTTFITKSGLLQTPYGPLIAQTIIAARSGNFNIQPIFSGALAQGQNVVNQFLSGDFYAGGLQGFYEVSQNCQNNYQCAYPASMDEVNKRVHEAQYLKEQEIQRNQGFQDVTKQVCDSPSGQSQSCASSCSGSGSGSSACASCKSSASQSSCRQVVVTPGSIIRENLNQALGSDLVTLENVHDINEIIGALMGQLINFVTTSSGGLSGASTPSRGKVNKNGTVSRISFLADLNSGTDLVSLAQARNPTLGLIDENLTKAKDPNRRTLYNGALDRVNQEEDLVNQMSSCYQDKLDPSFVPPLSASDGALAQERIDGGANTVSTLLEPVKSSLQNEISTISTKAGALQQIRNALTSATTVADINTIANSYKSKYANTGNSLEDDIKTLTDQVDSIGTDIQTQLDDCNALVATP